MHVETTRFGTIEARPEDLVVFPDGIPGFAGKREMIVMAGGDLLGLESDADHPTLFWLQDVTDPDLAFLTAVPWSAYPDYDIDADLAQRVGITEQNLSLLKSGKVKGMRFETLGRICEELECQPGDLLEAVESD